MFPRLRYIATVPCIKWIMLINLKLSIPIILPTMLTDFTYYSHGNADSYQVSPLNIYMQPFGKEQETIDCGFNF